VVRRTDLNLARYADREPITRPVSRCGPLKEFSSLQVSALDTRLHNTWRDSRNRALGERTSSGAAIVDVGRRPPESRGTPLPDLDSRRLDMPLWLTLIVVGIVMIVLGVATNIGSFLLWLGVIVLVVSLIMTFVGRGRSTV